MTTEPHPHTHPHPHPAPASGGPGRVIAIVALLAVATVGIAWAAGLFRVDTEGRLEAPAVRVEGGSVPKVAVETADVAVGTREEVIEVPTVEVRKPGE